MSWDQIIDYHVTDLKPSQQPVELGKRVITTKKSTPTPEYLTPFFDKIKFDFDIMFTMIPGGSNNLLGQENIVSINRNKSQVRNIDRNNQIQEQAQDEQMSSQKSKSDWGVSEPILKGIHLEEQKQQMHQKSKQESYWVDQKQKESEDPKQEQKNEGSQIENFTLQFLNAKSIQLESRQNKSGQQFSQRMEEQNEEMRVPGNILEISQIKQVMDKGEEEQKQEQEIQQISQPERMRIRKQLNEQKLKCLKYQIKTENCGKIILKVIIDPFKSWVRIKQLLPNDYMKIQNNKVIITHDSFIWEVGQSKRVVVPAILSIYCHSCHHQNKKCEIDTSNNSFSTICQNQNCTKNITFEITEIILQ